MKGKLIEIIIIFSIVILFPGCSLLLPHLLDGLSLNNSGLKDIVFINELSADNPNTGDWIEFYNNNARPVNLSDFHLSDSDTLDWQFPKGTVLPGNGYLVVTCDGTGTNGNSNFKLAAGTDRIILATPDKLTIIDQLLTFPATGMGSYGRSTDGDTIWKLFSVPTMGGANL